MIDKEKAKKHNIKTIDTSEKTINEKESLIQQLKKLIPNIVNSDNTVNINALADLIDISNTTANNQGYELTFAGKGLAKANADTPTTKELKIEHNLSKNFNDTQNIIIKGDNIDVLKILKSNYDSKIKMIYIDPPYNTQTENFIYKDNFKETDESLILNFNLPEETVNYLTNVYGTRSHSGWLSFMYPRLKLARDLLSDDGVIFVSIDDNELHNLKCIMDEIFGEENFISNIIWHSKYTTSNDSNTVSKQHENILLYTKNIMLCRLGLPPRTEKMDKAYSNPDNDKRGVWKATPLHAKSGNKNYTYKFKNGVEWTAPAGRFPRFSMETLRKMEEDNRIWFGKNLNSVPSAKTFLSEVKQGKTIGSLWSYDEVGHTHKANEELANIIGKGIFDNPKPIGLIKKCLQIGQSNLILDFFAGSGTTADAVIQLNAEDGGNRKFILVQIDELISEKKSKTAFDFCKQHNLEPTISSICIERVNRAGEKILEELNQKNGILFKTNLDIGYKVFSLTDKPSISINGNNFELFHHRESLLNTLYNMMVATSQTLDSKIIEIEKDKLYKINDAYYLINECDEKIIKSIKDNIIYIDAFSNINIETFLNIDIVNKDNIIIVYTA